MIRKLVLSFSALFATVMLCLIIMGEQYVEDDETLGGPVVPAQTVTDDPAQPVRHHHQPHHRHPRFPRIHRLFHPM